ncbi:MAG: DsbA family protein [Variovorax sp.]|nr:DsbA family protein [Variovorax sp.]
MRAALIGRTGVFSVLPGEDATAAAIGNTGVVVVSSPYLVGLLEEASHRAVRDLYEDDEATVGTRIDVRHLAPAVPGREVAAVARLEGQDGRLLRFAVSATQDGRELMRGTHERAVVNLKRFLSGRTLSAPTAPEASGGTPIEFLFDYHSPWCYFAALRIGAIARRLGRRLVWRPMHLARLIERIDGRRPLDANAAFVRWFKTDMLDAAGRLGIAFRYHPDFPLRPSRALRATAYADEQGKAEPFVIAVMRAYWSESKDISDLDELASLGASVGLDPHKVRASAEAPAFKQTVESNTLEAQERGVFGAPSFFCDGKLFWGNDHLDQLEEFANSGVGHERT